MSDTDSTEIELTDEDAAKLLDAPDTTDANDDARTPEAKPEKSDTDSTDWKAEAAKWKSLSRKHESTAKSTSERLKQFEDANKSEAERREERATAAETRAAKAESALKRREIAEAKAPEHATPAQIRAVAKRLAGDTDEALEEDADELFALLAPAPVKAKTPDRPKERLKGGSEPDEPVQETDPRKLAAAIPRGQLR